MVNFEERLSKDAEAALVEINETLKGFIAPQNIECNRSYIFVNKAVTFLRLIISA